MDPVTHSFVGASISAAGLRRATPLATATLVVAANAPDVDLLAQAWGPYVALAWRRGITHGIPAMLLLPFLVAAAILAWDRAVRLRRRREGTPDGSPAREPARPRAVLGLAFIGVWTHPVLDWLNNYGMRWLLPFDGRWTYGDAVFILDPWLWLTLGGALFLLYSRGWVALASWAALGAAMTFLVVGTGVAPHWARVLWAGGIAWLVLGRVVRPLDLEGPAGRRTARWALGAASAYMLVMTLQTPLQVRAVQHEAAAANIGPVEAVMVAPLPGDPFGGEVVVATPEAYHRGTFRWMRAPRVSFDGEVLSRLGEDDPRVRAAADDPDVRAFLVWSRFPTHSVEPDPGGWRVTIGDARYRDRRGGALTGLTVRLDSGLEPIAWSGRAWPEPRRRVTIDAGPGPLPDAPSSSAAEPLSDTALFRATFDSVWHRIANTHYDPEMRGVDWAGVRAELLPRALAASSEEGFRGVIREMLGRVGESHFVLLEGAAARVLAGGESDGSTRPGGADPGIRVRWLDGELLVVRVRDGSPAAAAGVRAGWLVDAVDGRAISDLARSLMVSLSGSAPGEEDPLRVHLPSAVAALLDGPEGVRIGVAFRDGEGNRRELTLARAAARDAIPVRFGLLPPMVVEVSDSTAMLEGGGRAGVIRLSAWFPAAADDFARAVDRHRGADGIVLDLRGNPGGVGALVMGLGGHFLDEPVALGEMRTRDATLRFAVNPQRVGPDGARVTPFAGPLAIVVDPLSASTSEIFAVGFQSLGRARIFGERTAGQALPALVVELPNGDRLMHAIADYVAPDGTRLEGRGVVPDELAAPDRVALLEGRDPAMDAALRWLASEAAANLPPPGSSPSSDPRP